MPTVLFVCEHGTVKSLIAKLYFDRYAAAAGLDVRAVSRGSASDSVVPPWMRTRLAGDGFVLGAWRPAPLRDADVRRAMSVVTFDLAPAVVRAPWGAPQSAWDGLPSVSTNYEAGREAIRERVRQLVDSLAVARAVARTRTGVQR